MIPKPVQTGCDDGLEPVACRRFRLSPARIITLSFALMILMGTILLSLPIASQDGKSVGFLDALFTATSANCVTGLVVVNTFAHWTAFGKAVILGLIQLGGLGLVTVLTIFSVLLHRRISLENRIIIQASFNQDSFCGMVRLVRSVVFITLIMEMAGALILAISFFSAGGYSLPQAFLKGVFHSISAFCNAGFDVIGPESLTAYVANWGIILPIMLLIIFGGLGFTVLRESAQFMRNKAKRPLWFRIRHLSLHAKFALLMTALLIVLGTVLFAVLEWNNPDTLGGLLWHQKLGGALFQSVTLRTAGFNTISQAGLTDISKFISGIFMIIGGSSGGTAGGIKVVTLGVVLAAIISAVRGKPKVEAFGRTLPMDILQKALTVLVTMLLVVFLSTFILHFTEQSSPFQHGFLDLFFEVASAAGTVGVTTGITPYLSSAGKVVIIICMFLGRLSPLTVVVSLNTRLSATPDSISYPDERVIIG